MNVDELFELAIDIACQYDYPIPTKVLLEPRYKYCLAKTQCEKRIIKVNKFVAEHNPIEVIEAILKHEIVHFIYCDHDKEFVKAVRAMGSHEKIESLFPLINLPFKYIYQCPKCHQNGYGNTQRETSCGYCSKTYDEQFKLKLVKVNEVIK